ncbi:MAG: acylphosphatase [bacterium]
MLKVRAHIYVEGLVQGVFFRAFVRSSAINEGVFGWVKNLYDSRVEAVLEGEKEAISRVIDQCRIGPPSAVVRHVEVAWEEYTGEFKRFGIRY